MKKTRPIYLLVWMLCIACSSQSQTQVAENKSMSTKANLEIATLGGGCFWCVEAVFQRIKGVESVVSGYTGGTKANPTYEDICTGKTGHAEVVQVYFDPSVISYEEILYVFFHTHDPTTLNKQGNDVGTQYRSAVFFADEKQKQAAEKVIQQVQTEGTWKNPIVTEVAALGTFYKAEEYHQNYYNNNSSQGYCVYVINPKVEKLKKDFKERLK